MTGGKVIAVIGAKWREFNELKKQNEIKQQDDELASSSRLDQQAPPDVDLNHPPSSSPPPLPTPTTTTSPPLPSPSPPSSPTHRDVIVSNISVNRNKIDDDLFTDDGDNDSNANGNNRISDKENESNHTIDPSALDTTKNPV